MRKGIIVTFYSYKGGVGRSFALANIAAILVRWRFRVLCIDWDIEAPGLRYYFTPYAVRSDLRPGLIEMLQSYAQNSDKWLDWRNYTTSLDLAGAGSLDLIQAGIQDHEYSGRVQSLDWEGMYEAGLGEAFEEMCGEFREVYDFILIDGRTGITDFGGIITAQLPDILAFLFTANEQSLDGAASVAERAAGLRNDLPFDRARLLHLPIPARFEASVEYEIAQNWKERYATRLGHFYDFWAVEGTPSRTLIEHTTIPYVPYWSFGERLSCIDDPSSSPSSINYNLESIAALIAHRLGRTDLLKVNRDAFVDAARRLGARSSGGVAGVFISYNSQEKSVAQELSEALRKRNVTIIDPNAQVKADDRMQIQDQVEELINRAQHMIVLVGPHSGRSRWVESEIRSFQRQSATEEGRIRYLVPVLLPGVKTSDVPKQLLNFQQIELENHSIEEVADQVAGIVAAEPPAVA